MSTDMKTTFDKQCDFLSRLMRSPLVQEEDLDQLESIKDSLCALNIILEVFELEKDLIRNPGRHLN